MFYHIQLKSPVKFINVIILRGMSHCGVSPTSVNYNSMDKSRLDILLLRNIVHKVKYYQEFRRSDHGTLGTDFDYVYLFKRPIIYPHKTQEKTVNKTK